ncbi:MAG: hypothetical protein H6618_08320 [Deltaproteobacteria bacterium]|nr:hypothetical protein [Deltaproteobacteria bacterium]
MRSVLFIALLTVTQLLLSRAQAAESSSGRRINIFLAAHDIRFHDIWFPSQRTEAAEEIIDLLKQANFRLSGPHFYSYPYVTIIDPHIMRPDSRWPDGFCQPFLDDLARENPYLQKLIHNRDFSPFQKDTAGYILYEDGWEFVQIYSHNATVRISSWYYKPEAAIVLSDMEPTEPVSFFCYQPLHQKATFYSIRSNRTYKRHEPTNVITANYSFP